MFMWKIETILKAYNDYLPKVSSVLEEINTKWNKEGLQADFSDEYAKMPRIPVDIGIMEQAEKRVVIPVDYGWNDVGSWKALYDVSDKDNNGNVLQCQNEIIDAKDNYVNTDKFVSLIGVNNLVVVESDNAILIADKDHSEDVKKIVEKLKKDDKKNLL